MTRIFACLTALVLTLSTAYSSEVEMAHELLFREGTLDEIAEKTMLVYDRSVSNTFNPEAEARDSGEITLSFKQEDVRLAHLEFMQGEKHRPMGEFPADIGNPMIMLFLESTVRDMTASVGGSPFYIRNRVKEAMSGKAEVLTGTAEYAGNEVATQTLTFMPFDGDENQSKMQDFGKLEISVTMSEDIPGWYLSLGAKAGEAYQARYEFKAEETAQ